MMPQLPIGVCATVSRWTACDFCYERFAALFHWGLLHPPRWTLVTRVDNALWSIDDHAQWRATGVLQ